jgi:ATP-dependent Clp protease ATP-binding subunit ClpA
MNLTKLYANGNNPDIIGRDKELDLLFLTLLRHEKPNALLLGEAGVGKTSIVHLAAYLIANNLCPSQLKGFQILEINSNAILAGPGYRGVTEEKFQNVINNALSNGKTILFMDEFHTIEHLGEMANGQTPGLGNTLKPYLTRPDFRVIGATTLEDFSRLTDKALLRRFFKIEIGEPNDEAVKNIITLCLKNYGKGITFKKGTVDKILELSKTLDGFNPDKAKDITDFVCSYCKLKDIDVVDEATLSKFFDQYFMMKVKQVQIQKEAVIEQ